MLQRARNENSSSFLREIEYALVLIEEPKIRNYFLAKMAKVLENRKNPNIKKTGEKDLKSEILSYLSQQGFAQTANVWARNIYLNAESINELLEILQKSLLQYHCQGILEIHPQDREINSPHIQYLGINAKTAEMVIAETLVGLGYETSVESALSKKNFQPFYLTENGQKARARLLDNAMEEKTAIELFIDSFEAKIDNFKNKLIQKSKAEKERLLMDFNEISSSFMSRMRLQKRRLNRFKRRM